MMTIEHAVDCLFNSAQSHLVADNRRKLYQNPKRIMTKIEQAVDCLFNSEMEWI